jgi:hypothetical protein
LSGTPPSACIETPGNVIVCGATTEKEDDTGEAGAYTLLPACVAVIVQTPWLTPLTEVPESEHTDDVELFKLTGSPDDAEADTVCAGLPRTKVGKEPMLIDCATKILKVTVTGTAAVKPLPPG